ncbi:ATP-dependent protease La (LON) domain protein [Thalassoglobus neptunius]|uniref:ATP-dependent protease La (LON) domain protein n=1 Tax=Thalassoglobus neptunius TaxID=1938619 RepID=A0A5C5X466_9PLAN|nr:LON peptidase substrate-binding domain-containing protein [Thalassoglobus neptunius]TWT57917.1 ATP-dependent protease La (LON) domain protein [Thalassoglobus neptunius]
MSSEIQNLLKPSIEPSQLSYPVLVLEDLPVLPEAAEVVIARAGLKRAFEQVVDEAADETVILVPDRTWIREGQIVCLARILRVEETSPDEMRVELRGLSRAEILETGSSHDSVAVRHLHDDSSTSSSDRREVRLAILQVLEHLFPEAVANRLLIPLLEIELSFSRLVALVSTVCDFEIDERFELPTEVSADRRAEWILDRLCVRSRRSLRDKVNGMPPFSSN